MYRLFVAPGQIDLQTKTARISGQDHLHIARVLRARTGQPVTLLDGLGNAYLATLTAVEKRESIARIEQPIDPPPEPTPYIVVAQALGKSDKFEQVIQHGTEAGACEFIPVQAERSVAEIPIGRLAERAARWQAISKGAAEQSFRARIPVVRLPTKLAAIAREAEAAGLPALLLHTGAPALPLYSALLEMRAVPTRMYLLVGPEGGWSPNELEIARSHGCITISLGPHILRTETAALVAISQLIYHFSRPQEFTSCVS